MTGPALQTVAASRPAGPDALANCLAAAARLLGRPATPESLVEGLALDEGGLTPELCVRAAERAGLAAKVVETGLDRLSALSLPAVLLLEDRDACLLCSRSAESAEIVSGLDGETRRAVGIAELAPLYSGTAILISPAVNFSAGTSTEKAFRTHHWFWGTLARSWPIYAEVALASVLVNVFTVLTPLFFMNVYDRVVPNKAFETLWVLVLGICLVYLFDLVLKTLRGYFVDVAGKRADVALSSMLFEQVMNTRLDVGRQPVGTLANNMREFESLREFFTSATMTTLVDLPFVLLFLAVIWAIGGWQMAAVPIVAIPIVIAAGLSLQVPLRDRIRRVFAATEAKHATLIETLGAIETVKSLGASAQLQRKWESLVSYVSAESLSTRVLSALAINFSVWVQLLVAVAMVTVGTYVLADNRLTMGGLIACTIISGRALQPLAQLAALLTRYHQAMSALSALNRLMQAPLDRPADRSFVHRARLRGDYALNDVLFRYPGQQIDAVNGVNMAVRAGDRVAVIGKVGSGKSTLAKLLVGLYEPQRGGLLLDGTDLRQIERVDLRRNIGYLPQNVVLFSGTVRDNLLLGAPQADDAQMLRAATASGLLEHLNRHPLGFDLPVGERGEALSGGQRQAVALARAMLLDPPILVLDEPTQGMDRAAEERFKMRLAETSRERTIVIVTHRESLLSIIDSLVIVDHGKVVAMGPKDAVLRALAEGKVPVAR